MLPEAPCIECKVSGVNVREKEGGREGGREGGKKKGWCDGQSQD